MNKISMCDMQTGFSPLFEDIVQVSSIFDAFSSLFEHGLLCKVKKKRGF
jgi:hypothetical protein